jgi:hypothetical protein
MQHSPDVGSALRNLVLYLQLRDRGAVPILVVQDKMVLLGYAVYQQGVLAADQNYDAATAIGRNIMRGGARVRRRGRCHPSLPALVGKITCGLARSTADGLTPPLPGSYRVASRRFPVVPRPNHLRWE